MARVLDNMRICLAVTFALWLVCSCGHHAEDTLAEFIGFSAVAERTSETRSGGSTLIGNADDLNVDGAEIAVYGYHGGNADFSGTTPVFETDGAKRVYYRSSGNAGDSYWDYDYAAGTDKVKWVRSDRYRFRAIYPYSLLPYVNMSSSAEILSVDYSLIRDDADLMVAYATRYPSEDTEGVGPVELKFSHALSALRFILKSDVADENVTDFYLTGLHQTGGLVYTSKDADDLRGEQSLYWIPSVSDYDTKVHHWTGTKSISGNSGTVVYDKSGFVFAIPLNGRDDKGELIVKECPEVRVNFYTDKGGSVLHTAALPTVRWEPGKKYTYTITVKSASLEVLVSIKPWSPIEAGSEIKL